ncbi:MAG TPA: hypothetical protein VKK61_11680 [Tepidisphaeraceae bacterium]|nr:hypothetical protein [Tepidisphaeraceae bacterium]
MISSLANDQALEQVICDELLKNLRGGIHISASTAAVAHGRGDLDWSGLAVEVFEAAGLDNGVKS